MAGRFHGWKCYAAVIDRLQLTPVLRASDDLLRLIFVQVSLIVLRQEQNKVQTESENYNQLKIHLNKQLIIERYIENVLLHS